MAINQKLEPTEHDNESQGSTLNTSSSTSSSDDQQSLSCSETYEMKHAEIDMIVKRIRRRRGAGRSRATSTASRAPSLRASPTCDKNSRRVRGSRTKVIANTSAESAPMTMIKRLYVQLDSLKSLLPPAARTSGTCSTVLVDALRYRKALEKDIDLLLMALPYSNQVNVRRVECGGLQIEIFCKKKSGLMVALMEVMESFGLHFANVNVSCQDDNIVIDALSTQESIGKAGALKGMLVATITRFSRR